MPSPQELKQEKEKLQKVIAEVKEGVIIVDPQQNVSLMNKSAEEITGHGSVEALGKPIGHILTVLDNEKEVHPDTYCPVSGVKLEGIVYEKDNLQLVSKKEEIKVVNLKAQKMKDGMEMGVGCILTIEDTFAQSELERMKLDFVAMSVHVLRTPLSILKGYLSYLTKRETLQKLNETEADYLKNSVVSTDELVYLVDNLLDLTELQASGFRISPIPLDLDKAVQSVVYEFKPFADAKMLEIIYAPSLSELPLVYADATRLKIVLRNLISNAIKFTDGGSVEITVAQESSDFLKVTVKDTGRGIPEKNLPHLFKKFYRVKEALEMETGRGLGLYVSKEIVGSHGGKIGVESKEGVGSTFWFTIPVYKERK